jgi:hypothetical protein
MYDVLVFDGRLRWRELEEDEVCKEASNLFFFSFWDFDHDRLLGSEVVRGRCGKKMKTWVCSFFFFKNERDIVVILVSHYISIKMTYKHMIWQKKWTYHQT